MSTQEQIEEHFLSIFGKSSDFQIKAPGRINILGEHTDYNNGFVMPSAIDKAIYYSIGKRQDFELHIEAIDLENNFHFENINEISISEKGWSNHLSGVILEIQKLGFSFSHGLNVCFGGDIPNGGGLSSSAAVEAGFGFALNHIFDLKLDLLTLAKVAQSTEHNHIGVNCGIMDMYASLFSKKDHIIKLDCQDLLSELLPTNFKNHKFILINSGVKHNLADTEYNVRRQQCQEGVAALQALDSQIISLRDAKIEQLKAIKSKINPAVFNRCLYIIEENQRVLNAVKALEKNDLDELGKLMKQTHLGLSELYEVSCTELDFLFDTAKDIEGVVGCRMMGGGFGGCTLNLIENEMEVVFVEKISNAYLSKFGFIPEIYAVNLSEGVALYHPEHE